MPVAPEEVVGGLVFPECPRWRPDGLWFSDQHAGHIQRVGTTGSAEVMVEVPGGPSGLGWLSDGSLMAVSMHDRKLLRIRFHGGGGPGATARPEVTVAADLSHLHPGHSNDMVVDRRGRCFIGNIGYDIHGGEPPRPTVLVLVEPASAPVTEAGEIGPMGEPRVVARDLVVPNGTVISEEGDRLIIAESMAHRLTSFRIADDGQLVDRRVFADLAGETPDGICLDAEGAVWFASVGRREVVRVTDAGRVTDRVSTGPRRAIACMLGGEDRRDLFICVTGSIDPVKALALRQGAIEVCRVDVPGAGLP